MSAAVWVTVAGRKGGVGKSTAVLCLAAYYRRAGKRVLVVDLDPQASVSAHFDLVSDGAHLARILQGEADPQPSEAMGILALPGGPQVGAVAAAGGERVVDLRAALSQVPADVVLVDCPPGQPGLDRIGMRAADVVLVATESHRLAIAGAARLLQEAQAVCGRCALLVGRLDGRRTLDRAAPSLLASAFGVPVLSLRQDGQLSAALHMGQDPPASGKAAADAAEVAAWIGGGHE
jgi:chromosome partitioning protein